jgi:hypothetical protein
MFPGGESQHWIFSVETTGSALSPSLPKGFSLSSSVYTRHDYPGTSVDFARFAKRS